LPLALEVARVGTRGRVLDAGCSLLPSMNTLSTSLVASIVHLTQNIEHEDIKRRGQLGSYCSGDVRDLSLFADRAFDRVVCVSTLEHVGGNNTPYGGDDEYDPDSVEDAFLELWRVTGQVLFITVPVHPSGKTNGRWRYFQPDEFQRLVRETMPAPRVLETVYYRGGPGGWWGGATTPYPSSPVAAEKVEQIACLKVMR
jgi:hypothetical protein